MPETLAAVSATLVQDTATALARAIALEAVLEHKLAGVLARRVRERLERAFATWQRAVRRRLLVRCVRMSLSGGAVNMGVAVAVTLTHHRGTGTRGFSGFRSMRGVRARSARSAASRAWASLRGLMCH